MDKPDQEWRPLPGWEGLYEVSAMGLVWSTIRRRGTAGGLLKTPVDNRGYPQVNLCRNGKPVHTHVHVLVATAFHGPCPPGMECRHLDGDPTNNAATNLAWGTTAENNRDLVRHGTHFSKNRGATHCLAGHEFTPENTILRTRVGGGRACRKCKQRRSSEQAERRRLARQARRGRFLGESAGAVLLSQRCQATSAPA